MLCMSRWLRPPQLPGCGRARVHIPAPRRSAAAVAVVIIWEALVTEGIRVRRKRGVWHAELVRRYTQLRRHEHGPEAGHPPGKRLGAVAREGGLRREGAVLEQHCEEAEERERVRKVATQREHGGQADRAQRCRRCAGGVAKEYDVDPRADDGCVGSEGGSADGPLELWGRGRRADGVRPEHPREVPVPAPR